MKKEVYEKPIVEIVELLTTVLTNVSIPEEVETDPTWEAISKIGSIM